MVCRSAWRLRSANSRNPGCRWRCNGTRWRAVPSGRSSMTDPWDWGERRPSPDRCAPSARNRAVRQCALPYDSPLVIAGLDPRLSGTICASCCHLLHCGPSTTCTTPLSRSRSERAKLEGDLWRWWCWRCLEKRGEWSSMHQVCSDEPCEGERALDDPVAVMGQAQQQKSNQRDRNLNADGILGGSQEVIDFQDLFDPSKEQLDGPATLVQGGDFFCARGQIVGEDAQHLAGLAHDLAL